MWIKFQSIATLLSPGTPVSLLLKINSHSNPSGCGAVLWSHIWIMFRGRASSRQHSSFGPTSLSCALCNSVYRLQERVISRSDIIIINDQRSYKNRKIKLLCILIFCLGSVPSAQLLFMSWLCFMHDFLLLIRCPTRKQNKDYAMYLLTVLYHESWVSISCFLYFLSRLLRKSLCSGRGMDKP